MALDAMLLRGLVAELARELEGAKIEKIQQPARGTVVLTLKGGQRRDLLIGGSTGAPRICLTREVTEKPQEPPMFCMLLRKHLTGARVLEVSQPGLDRVVKIHLTAPGVFGEGEERYLWAELFGRTANLVLTDGEGVITGCLYRVGSAEERRAVLPGMVYRLPPMQDKRDLLSMTDGEIDAALAQLEDHRPLDRALVGEYLGLSPLVARELCQRSYSDPSPRVGEGRERDGLAALSGVLRELRDTVLSGNMRPCLVSDPAGEPMDFTYMPVTQYGEGYGLTEYPDFSSLLDAFWARRDTEERRRQRSRELTKTVRVARDRVARRLEVQRRELTQTENRDWLRECGDIITANIYNMYKGQRELTAEDFYSPSGGTRTIPLDPLKTPQQNAAKYYKDYTRAKSAREHLTGRIESGEAELEYLESVLEELDRAETERDLADIRAELAECGYVRDQAKGGRTKHRPSQPMRFESGAGLLIRAGRNNVQNEELTLKNSSKSDLWLHASRMPGSHVVISCQGRPADPESIAEAASIAAWYSRGRGSAKVPVDVTEVREIKKPAGSRPGTVIYHTYRTVMAVPDEALVEKLKRQ